MAVTVVEPAESAFLTEGEAGSHTIEGVGLGFRPPFLDADSYDEVIAVPERTARRYARDVARNDGVFAGTSTGMNVAAAVEVARRRNGGAVVTVTVDSGLKYLHGELYRRAATMLRSSAEHVLERSAELPGPVWGFTP